MSCRPGFLLRSRLSPIRRDGGYGAPRKPAVAAVNDGRTLRQVGLWRDRSHLPVVLVSVRQIA